MCISHLDLTEQPFGVEPLGRRLLSRYSSILKLVTAFLLFNLTFIPRALVAPYTSHGYNVRVFEVWIQRILTEGLNFYIQPTPDMLTPDPSWGHDPSFSEYPPIYIYSLWIIGELYEHLSPQGNPYLLVLLIKLPMIISESILTVLIFFIVSRRRGLVPGVLAASMYAIQPFCFSTEGVGAYAEGMTPLFGILSLYMATQRRYHAAAMFFGLAMMVKPSAFVFLFPLVIFMYDDNKPSFSKVLVFTVIPMVLVPLPFLIVEPGNYISAMLWGGFHNLGRRMPTGVIWVNPSFWNFVRYLSGDAYGIIAPTQIFFYIVMTGWLWRQAARRGLNKEKSNIWFVGFIFVFSMMMFLPAAHEKWIYPAYPLLAVSTFLSQSEKIRRFSLFVFLVLTVTYFQFIFAPIQSVQYHFGSTEVLSPIGERLQAMNPASKWLYEWLYYSCESLSIFTGEPFMFLYTFANVALFIGLCSMITKAKMTPEKKEPCPPRATSIKPIEDETNAELKAFQSAVKEVKETSLKLEELTKLFKSGEIPENAYKLVMSELGDHLSMLVEEIFKLRETLELDRARAKLEWAKEKIGLKEFEIPEHARVSAAEEAYLKRQLYAPLYRWEDIISKINSALSSLTMDEEASIIEQYLSLVKERLSPKAGSEESKGGRTVCQHRLNSISEKWASLRRDKIEQVVNLELKASQIKEEVEEVEVRFAVGELDQTAYEYRMSILEGSLKKVEKGIYDIRHCIDGMDIKMFRCLALLREKP